MIEMHFRGCQIGVAEVTGTDEAGAEVKMKRLALIDPSGITVVTDLSQEAADSIASALRGTPLVIARDFTGHLSPGGVLRAAPLNGNGH